MGPMTWSLPFQGEFIVHRLGFAMINLHARFDVSMFTHYEDIKKQSKMYKLGCFGVRDHPRSPAMSQFDRAPMTSYFTLRETMRLSLQYRFRVIVSYLSKVAYFNLPHLHLAPSLGDPVWIFRDLWHLKTTIPGLSWGVFVWFCI